eukprot:gene5500-5295_t
MIHQRRSAVVSATGEVEAGDSSLLRFLSLSRAAGWAVEEGGVGDLLPKGARGIR